jgi:C1A family cysteine protease
MSVSAFKVVSLIISIALGVITYQQVVSKVIHPTTSNSDQLLPVWNAWKSEYAKTYTSSAEEAHRFAVFSANNERVLAHNSNPEYTYTLELNQFADLTGDEFSAAYASCHNGNGIIGGLNDEYCPSAENCPKLTPPNSTFTANWETAGAVTGVKNQEQCGSCWAFSTTGSLEGLYFLNKSLLVSFSEQQLVDCDKTCQNCEGCFPYLAMVYTAKEGIEPEALYPYKGVKGTCKYNADAALHANTGYQCIAQKDQGQLLAGLLGQPVSIAVEADQNAWQLYSKGVVNTACGTALDHAVLLVGYLPYQGESSQSYYVKNSWGASWGMNGYIWIGTDTKANSGYGVCGILRCATLPINA